MTLSRWLAISGSWVTMTRVAPISLQPPDSQPPQVELTPLAVDPFDDDDRGRHHPSALGQPAMGDEVILGQIHRFPATQRVQMIQQQRIVEGIGMVVIESQALGPA